MSTPIIMRVEALAAEHISNATRAAQDLANRIGIGVELNFNEKRSYFYPQSWRDDGTPVALSIVYLIGNKLGEHHLDRMIGRTIVSLVPELREKINAEIAAKPKWEVGYAPHANKQLPYAALRGEDAQGYFRTEADALVAMAALRAERGE